MDYLGTADYLTSPVSGKVESWTHYNEWGLITHNAVLKCGQRELDLVKRYATHDYDSVLELYYAKARFYDAHDRRFTAMDPVKGNIFEPMSMVQYLYVLDNPNVLIDPLGLSPYDTVRTLDWSSVRKKWFFVDSEDNATEYINVHDVWSRLNKSYKTATSKYLMDSWEFSLSADNQSLKLVVPKNSNQGTAYYNGKNSRFSVRYDNNSVYMAKGTLINYFKQAWSKSENLDSKTVNTIVKVQEVVKPQEIVQNQIETQVNLGVQQIEKNWDNDVKQRIVAQLNGMVSSIANAVGDVTKHFTNDVRRTDLERGVVASIIINAGDSGAAILQSMINAGNILTGQLPSMWYYEQYLKSSKDVNNYFASGSVYQDSY